MSSLVHPQLPRTGERDDTSPKAHNLVGGVRYDWLFSVLGVIFVGGAFLDGWAHNHGKVDNSFFTVWHAFFYSGFLVIALLLAGTLWRNRRRGVAWHAALPAGYAVSMLGILIFAAGGVGDMLWHEIFGIEADIDALFSPSHLVLALGMNMTITGPLRAAWARPGYRLTWRTAGPMLLALASLISGFTFLLMASHPLTANIAGAEHSYTNRIGQIAGTSSILLTTALLMGPTLLVLRRWRLPAGSLILVWGLNTLAMFIVNWSHDYTLWLACAMLAAIIVIEAVRLRMEPLAEQPGAFRRFAALAPVLLMGSYFLALPFTEGTRWSIHMLTGIVVEAGIAGWLLSYLVLPPAVPDK